MVAAMSCHPLKFCTFLSIHLEVQRLAAFQKQTFIQAIKQLPTKCESNVNDKSLVHLAKGQAVSHQRQRVDTIPINCSYSTAPS